MDDRSVLRFSQQTDESPFASPRPPTAPVPARKKRNACDDFVELIDSAGYFWHPDENETAVFKPGCTDVTFSNNLKSSLHKMDAQKRMNIIEDGFWRILCGSKRDANHALALLSPTKTEDGQCCNSIVRTLLSIKCCQAEVLRKLMRCLTLCVDDSQIASDPGWGNVPTLIIEQLRYLDTVYNSDGNKDEIITAVESVRASMALAPCPGWLHDLVQIFPECVHSAEAQNDAADRLLSMLPQRDGNQAHRSQLGVCVDPDFHIGAAVLEAVEKCELKPDVAEDAVLRARDALDFAVAYCRDKIDPSLPPAAALTEQKWERVSKFFIAAVQLILTLVPQSMEQSSGAKAVDQASRVLLAAAVHGCSARLAKQSANVIREAARRGRIHSDVVLKEVAGVNSLMLAHFGSFKSFAESLTRDANVVPISQRGFVADAARILYKACFDCVRADIMRQWTIFGALAAHVGAGGSKPESTVALQCLSEFAASDNQQVLNQMSLFFRGLLTSVNDLDAHQIKLLTGVLSRLATTLEACDNLGDTLASELELTLSKWSRNTGTMAPAGPSSVCSGNNGQRICAVLGALAFVKSDIVMKLKTPDGQLVAGSQCTLKSSEQWFSELLHTTENDAIGRALLYDEFARIINELGAELTAELGRRGHLSLPPVLQKVVEHVLNFFQENFIMNGPKNGGPFEGDIDSRAPMLFAHGVPPMFGIHAPGANEFSNERPCVKLASLSGVKGHFLRCCLIPAFGLLTAMARWCKQFTVDRLSGGNESVAIKLKELAEMALCLLHAPILIYDDDCLETRLNTASQQTKLEMCNVFYLAVHFLTAATNGIKLLDWRGSANDYCAIEDLTRMSLRLKDIEAVIESLKKCVNSIQQYPLPAYGGFMPESMSCSGALSLVADVQTKSTVEGRKRKASDTQAQQPNDTTLWVVNQLRDATNLPGTSAMGTQLGRPTTPATQRHGAKKSTKSSKASNATADGRKAVPVSSCAAVLPPLCADVLCALCTAPVEMSSDGKALLGEDDLLFEDPRPRYGCRISLKELSSVAQRLAALLDNCNGMKSDGAFSRNATQEPADATARDPSPVQSALSIVPKLKTFVDKTSGVLERCHVGTLSNQSDVGPVADSAENLLMVDTLASVLHIVRLLIRDDDAAAAVVQKFNASEHGNATYGSMIYVANTFMRKPFWGAMSSQVEVKMLPTSFEGMRCGSEVLNLLNALMVMLSRQADTVENTGDPLMSDARALLGRVSKAFLQTDWEVPQLQKRQYVQNVRAALNVYLCASCTTYDMVSHVATLVQQVWSNPTPLPEDQDENTNLGNDFVTFNNETLAAYYECAWKTLCEAIEKFPKSGELKQLNKDTCQTQETKSREDAVVGRHVNSWTVAIDTFNQLVSALTGSQQTYCHQAAVVTAVLRYSRSFILTTMQRDSTFLCLLSSHRLMESAESCRQLTALPRKMQRGRKALFKLCDSLRVAAPRMTGKELKSKTIIRLIGQVRCALDLQLRRIQTALRAGGFAGKASERDLVRVGHLKHRYFLEPDKDLLQIMEEDKAAVDNDDVGEEVFDSDEENTNDNRIENDENSNDAEITDGGSVQF